MDIIISLLKTSLICVAAYYVGHIIAPKLKYYWLSDNGRLGRLSYCWRLLLLGIGVVLFENFTDALFESVVSTPSYWGIKVLVFMGYFLFSLFYYPLYARRMQDFSLPGIFGLLWTAVFLFSAFYSVVKSTAFVFAVILTLGNLILLFIPGNSGPNPYGEASNTYMEQEGVSNFRNRKKSRLSR